MYQILFEFGRTWILFSSIWFEIKSNVIKLKKIELIIVNFSIIPQKVETLRMHPAAPTLFRVCVENYKIPDSHVTIEKGTGIVISISGLHRDSRHFPEPEKFNPERFSKENSSKRSPYVYLPFGDGPRICIGKKICIG